MTLFVGKGLSDAFLLVDEWRQKLWNKDGKFLKVFLRDCEKCRRKRLFFMNALSCAVLEARKNVWTIGLLFPMKNIK